MTVECISIILVILCTSFIFFRTKRKDYAIAVLPLTIVPFIHFIAYHAVNYSFAVLKSNAGKILPMSDIIALVLSCIIVGIMSGSIKSKTARRSYIAISTVFLIALVWIFIYDIIA